MSALEWQSFKELSTFYVQNGMCSANGVALLWQLPAVFDSCLRDKPTTSTALLFLPCLGWEREGRREFEIQVTTHFGAFLLGTTLNSAVQPGGHGVWLGGLQLCVYQVCSWHPRSWAYPLQP